MFTTVKGLTNDLIAAFLAAGLAAAGSSAAGAQDAKAPMSPQQEIQESLPGILSVTSKLDIINDPNIYDYDPESTPQPGDRYYNAWVTRNETSWPGETKGSMVSRKNFDLSSVFVHIDENGCRVDQYNSKELSRSKNSDAPRAKMELDALIEKLRQAPDEVYKVPEGSLPDPCRGPTTLLKYKFSRNFG